jgi:hypothetical protein
MSCVPLRKKRRKNPFFSLFIIHGFKVGGDSVIKKKNIFNIKILI